MLLAGALTPAVSAASAQAPASITDATTGLSDAATVAPVDACAPSSAFRATCLAQVLGVRGSARARPSEAAAAGVPATGSSGRERGAATPPRQPSQPPARPSPGPRRTSRRPTTSRTCRRPRGPDETVAIVDAFDDPNAESDLAAYRAEFGLPPCTSANGCFTKVDQNGGTNYPTTVDSGWELEISLDLDAVSALCPNCHIDLVEANSAGSSDLAAAQHEAGHAARGRRDLGQLGRGPERPPRRASS